MRIGNIVGSLIGLFILPACTNELGNWSPYDINDTGVIVGAQNGSFAAFGGQAVSYRGSGPLVSLKAPNGATGTTASSISNDGTIVGDAMIPNSGLTAIYWDASGEPHLVPRLDGWTSSHATAINGRGVITGFATAPWSAALGSFRPWVFDIKTAELTELPVPPPPRLADAPSVYPEAINDAGEVVGYAWLDNSFRPVRWATGTHELQPLPSASGTPATGIAVGINNAGAIFGLAGNFTPVIWENGAAPRPLPFGLCRSVIFEGGEGFPFGLSAPGAINDSGAVVANIVGPQGCATSNAPGSDAGSEPTDHVYAVRWSANGTLSVLGEDQYFVRSLNAAGSAVGSKGLVAQRWP